MKKIMIIAAIVCAASFAHAGAYVWGAVGGVEGPTGDYTLDDITATLFLGGNAIASSPADPDGAFGQYDTGNPANHASVNQLTSGEDYDNCQSFVLKLTTSDGKWEYSTGIDAIPYEEVGMGTSTFMQMAYQDWGVAAGDWQSVPEPTSGLLLLLGVAGLALRRRRA